jgi:hypothetical protein
MLSDPEAAADDVEAGAVGGQGPGDRIAEIDGAIAHLAATDDLRPSGTA